MAQLICQNLSVGYDKKAIVSDINFTLEKGDYLCILGANGSGKSALVKTLLRLIPSVSGSFSVGDGVSLGTIGYLPQQNDIQRDFPASVWEIVTSGFVAKRGRGIFLNRSLKQQACDIMDRLGISELRSRSFCQLSGGQQARVLLARALCAAENMLLLDEPAAALDPEAAEVMYSLISELNSKDGITIVMVSHDIPAALSHANRILHISDRSFFGSVEDYRSYLLNSHERGSSL